MTTITFSGAHRLARAGEVLNLGAALRVLRAMLGRHAERQALARMDDRLLADIGISREQALVEVSKPFWRG